MIFQDAVGVSLDDISRELIRGLPDNLSDPRASDRSWTNAVLGGLCDMGKGRNLYVSCHSYADHCSPGQGEWLLDVVWMPQHDWRIVLAVESEWGNLASIEEDFGKLLSIKAHRKLFFFTTKNHQAESIIKRLEENMSAYPYHLAGEEYMLLEVTKPGAFRYRFEVPVDGKLDSVTFEQTGGPLPWPWPWKP